MKVAEAAPFTQGDKSYQHVFFNSLLATEPIVGLSLFISISLACTVGLNVDKLSFVAVEFKINVVYLRIHANCCSKATVEELNKCNTDLFKVDHISSSAYPLFNPRLHLFRYPISS